MKKCTYCGKEYPDDVERCAIDFEPLAAPGPATVNQKPAWHPNVFNLQSLEGAFDFQEGFSRPHWKLIGQTIENSVPSENHDAAWREASIQWVQQLQRDLGGEYHVRFSSEFVLLSTLPKDEADRLLAFAERTQENIYRSLGEAAWVAGSGMHVVLLFHEEDDYYQYISRFYPEGEHILSAGCLINQDYVHVAMHYDGKGVRSTLTHELFHNNVVHLSLPLWLDEGLPVMFDRAAMDWNTPIIDHDLRERHFEFWNESNIQEFWAGVSFGNPGDPSELSYSLAEILVNLLQTEYQNLPLFIKQAQWGDAGQTAALTCLNLDLGHLVGTFLGPGNWRPNRKAMVEHWKTAGRSETQGES